MIAQKNACSFCDVMEILLVSKCLTDSGI